MNAARYSEHRQPRGERWGRKGEKESSRTFALPASSHLPSSITSALAPLPKDATTASLDEPRAPMSMHHFPHTAHSTSRKKHHRIILKTYHLVQSSSTLHNSIHTRPYRMLRMFAFVLDLPCPPLSPSLPSLLFFVFGTSHTLQNFRFSSPAPVHTTSPAGPMQLHSTRESCASRISITLSILG